MKEQNNIWGIKEYEGDGVSCPIVPASLPWYKKVFLAIFRFGICPACITMSIAHCIKVVHGNFRAAQTIPAAHHFKALPLLPEDELVLILHYFLQTTSQKILKRRRHHG